MSNSSPSSPQAQPGRPSTKQPWLWNVVLLDDQDHTYDYVIRMMQNLFGHAKDRADQIAYTVDRQGRAVCTTTHKEHAELKREQILSFGRDPLVAQSKGPMSAVIEPAETDGEGGEGGGGSGGERNDNRQ
jgi:ATP-dependent Clp protease adaptor protein ClpS